MAKVAVQAKKPAPPVTKPQPRQEVAKRSAGAVSLDVVPKFAQGMRGMGTEQIGASDVETPRLKLLQLVSPECEEFNEAKAGHFWHSVAERDLGERLRIVPLYIDMRAILWRPRHEGGGILARADDGQHWVPPNASWTVKPYKDNKKTVTWTTKPTVAESGLLDWGSMDPDDSGSQPAATRMYNMAVALPDFPDLGVGVVTLQRASISVARKFMGKLKLISAPSFAIYVNMENVKDTNATGDTFFNFKFTTAGFVQDEAEFGAYKDLYEAFKRMGLNIKDLESAQDEGGPTVTGKAAPADRPNY